MYDEPAVTPPSVRPGAVLGGGETFTVNVAGVSKNDPPVLFDVSAMVIVVLPAATGVMVTVLVSPHDVNVAVAGATVAIVGSLEVIEKLAVVPPVRLQPFLPSLLRGW